MSKRRSTLEKELQRQIEVELGSERDLLLLRNSVGRATYVSDAGREYHVPYGLAVGSPDLIGILRVSFAGLTFGVWLCFEVKADKGELEPDQIACHALWTSFGAIVETVRSAAEARAALERTRAVFARAAA